MFGKLYTAFKNTQFKQLALDWSACHLCGWKIQIKTHNDEMAVRCSRCLASPVSQMMGQAFSQYYHSSTKDVYELSSRGAFVKYLQKHKINLTLSEYFDDVELGLFNGNIQCQNVESLTFNDNSFDICTSLEVFEHVANDKQGFKEIYRVLKNKGIFIFTVPINLKNITVERTEITNGKRKNILPEEYHSDSLRGERQVFCYRNYGTDIIQRLEQAGFIDCKILKPSASELFGYARPVIVAIKPDD